LWYSIADSVDASHWENPDDEVYLNLRHDSFELIAKMVNGLHVAVAAHRATNVQARLRMLQAITRPDQDAPWPILPKDEICYPTSPDGWKAYREHYPVCSDSKDFASFFRFCGQDGSDLFWGISGQRLQDVLDGNPAEDGHTSSTPAASGETNSHPRCASPDHRAPSPPPTTGHTTEECDKSNSQPLTQAVGSPPMENQQTAVATVLPPPCVATGDGSVDDEDGLDGVFFNDNGNLLSAGTYDDDDEPSESQAMYMGPEEHRVDQERIQLISRFLHVDKDADMRAISSFVQLMNPPVEFLCQRGFDLARLGNDGLTRYCMDLMRSDAIIYEDLTQYFAHRQANCLQRTRELADELKVTNEKRATLERQTGNFRLESTRRTVDQQLVNSSRRQLNRLQAQANGQRIGFLRAGNSNSMLSSLPPLVPLPSRTASTAPANAIPQSDALEASRSSTRDDSSGCSTVRCQGFGGFGDQGFDEKKFAE
jgi:hypothetical protein